ncbi:MAG: hypothetical protein EOO08_06895 [Chitinophagaceae bacterium]|nr:MAG: hypothetical protein EOO08_06895 [Chitinophagaceae bacterium]
MEPRKNIAQELQEAGVNLPAGLNARPYAVPAGYFALFAEAVLREIRRREASDELQQVSPLLAGLQRSMPYSVPPGYFGEAVVPSLLDGLDRTMPFAVPAGYFEGLPQQLLSRANAVAEPVEEAPVQARVLRMRPRWMQVAAAAVVAGALAVGGWLYEGNSGSSGPEVVMQSGLRTVSDQALEDFIQNTAPNASASTATAQGEVKAMLKDVPLSEMDAFLEQVPLDDVSDMN